MANLLEIVEMDSSRRLETLYLFFLRLIRLVLEGREVKELCRGILGIGQVYLGTAFKVVHNLQRLLWNHCLRVGRKDVVTVGHLAYFIRYF